MTKGRDLEPVRGGAIASLFGQRGNELERRHSAELDYMAREAEATEEGIALIHQVGRTSIEETCLTASWRDAAMQRDPQGAQLYVQMWYDVAQAGQSMVRSLPRRLR